MKTFFLLWLMLLTAFCVTTDAQQPTVLAMNVAATPPIADTTEFGVPVINASTFFTTVMNVVLAGTDSIYQVHVKLGSSLHGSEYLASSFDYGVNGSFGSTTYSQTGNVIVLELGAYEGMISYYAEVQIEKSDHTFEDAVLFSNN